MWLGGVIHVKFGPIDAGVGAFGPEKQNENITQFRMKSPCRDVSFA